MLYLALLTWERGLNLRPAWAHPLPLMHEGVEKMARLTRIATAAALLGAGSCAMAQTAWGIWNNGPNSQTIVTFNVATPNVFNVIGATGVVSNPTFANGLEWNGTGTNLYMSVASATNFLYDINPATGAATNPRGSGLVGTDTIGDLSYDRFSNRMLGIGTPGTAGGGARLYSINTTTGVATNLGSIGGFTEGFTVSLAVRPSDGLIFAHGIETDRWYTINPGTLAATALPPLGVDTNFGQGASFDPVTGNLYHAILTTTGGNQSRLATIDTVTGLPTFIGTMGASGLNQVGDIAFVPAPGALALLGLGGLLSARRRR